MSQDLDWMRQNSYHGVLLEVMVNVCILLDSVTYKLTECLLRWLFSLGNKRGKHCVTWSIVNMIVAASRSRLACLVNYYYYYYSNQKSCTKALPQEYNFSTPTPVGLAAAELQLLYNVCLTSSTGRWFQECEAVDNSI